MLNFYSVNKWLPLGTHINSWISFCNCWKLGENVSAFILQNNCMNCTYHQQTYQNVFANGSFRKLFLIQQCMTGRPPSWKLLYRDRWTCFLYSANSSSSTLISFFTINHNNSFSDIKDVQILTLIISWKCCYFCLYELLCEISHPISWKIEMKTVVHFCNVFFLIELKYLFFPHYASK